MSLQSNPVIRRNKMVYYNMSVQLKHTPHQLTYGFYSRPSWQYDIDNRSEKELHTLTVINSWHKQ